MISAWWLAAPILAALVFDAWVYRVARMRGYRDGARRFAPPHVPEQNGDTTHCTKCGFTWDTNDDLDLPPCDYHANGQDERDYYRNTDFSRKDHGR